MSRLDLERAKFALEQINTVKEDEHRENYLIELRDLPARLHTGGLGQTVASLLASGGRNKVRLKIYDWLEEWLRRRPIQYPINAQEGRRLIDCIVGSKLPSGVRTASYAAASREARALATWLKKFAEAFIPKKEA